MPAPGDCQVSILLATPAAAQACAALHARLFDPAWDAQSFHKLIAHPAARAFLARLEAPPTTVGFILGQVAADEAEILTLAVAADQQRRGIATRLIEALARAAGEAAARVLYLEVDAGNTAALALYRKLGFAERGRRRGYYVKANTAPSDAVTLARAL